MKDILGQRRAQDEIRVFGNLMRLNLCPFTSFISLNSSYPFITYLLFLLCYWCLLLEPVLQLVMFFRWPWWIISFFCIILHFLSMQPINAFHYITCLRIQSTPSFERLASNSPQVFNYLKNVWCPHLHMAHMNQTASFLTA